MPPCSFKRISTHSAHLLWHIDESEEVLLRDSTLSTQVQPEYARITHPRKRREWLAARLALKKLVARLGHQHTELQKNAWGQPHLVKSGLYLSIAHCSPFAFVAVDQQHPIGVDIQLPCKKLYRIREKFLDHRELQKSDNTLEQLCIYWCAKEAIYKAHGGKNLSLKQGISIRAFTTKVRGTVWGEIGTQLFTVDYNFYNGHVLAWSKEAKGDVVVQHR